MKYKLTEWGKKRAHIVSNDLVTFIKRLDKFVAPHDKPSAHRSNKSDAFWDAFWGGSFYIHLIKGYYTEVDPAAFIEGVYYVQEVAEVDLLRYSWFNPGIGSSINDLFDQEEMESARDVFELVLKHEYNIELTDERVWAALIPKIARTQK